MNDRASGVNPHIANIEEAQTEIRLIVKEAYLHGWTKEAVNKRIARIVEKTVKDVKIERLRRDIANSLWNFANKQRILWQRLTVSPSIIVAMSLALENKPTMTVESRFSVVDKAQVEYLTYEQHQKGVPLREFYGDVWKTRVKPMLERLCRENALDPNDYAGRNSLRNLAEMETRYQDHQDNVQRLRDKGVKLVICSAHADCSDRCKPYQGRIYSLDGSRGTTFDGKPYVPLEEATQNAADRYVTKAGRVYQNGLLGFNCRHKLYEYRGQAVPVVSENERRIEYAITKQQRLLERQVRTAKTEALMYSDINKAYAKQMRLKARELYNKYVEFSRRNNRAFYPMRVAI